MFSALRQGSIVYIVEKGENAKLKIGTVINVTQPTYNSNFLMNQPINISTQVNDSNMDFKNLPGNQGIATYNNVIISESKELMSNEINNELQRSRSIVDSASYHTNAAKAYESILKELNPQYAKEKERDEDINNLKDKMIGIESKMDQILTILAKESK